MSIENITQKIVQEAESGAKEVLNEAQAKSSAIEAEASIEAEELLKAAKSKAAKDAEVLKSRKTSVAELESRKMMLAAKQEAVKKSFDIALGKVVNMPEDEYVSFLKDMIKSLGVDKGEIVLNSKDKERIGNKLKDAANKEIGGKLTLSPRTLNSAGGFILKSGDIELNCTVERIIGSVKEELTLNVVEALFK